MSLFVTSKTHHLLQLVDFGSSHLANFAIVCDPHVANYMWAVFATVPLFCHLWEAMACIQISLFPNLSDMNIISSRWHGLGMRYLNVLAMMNAPNMHTAGDCIVIITVHSLHIIELLSLSGNRTSK